MIPYIIFIILILLFRGIKKPFYIYIAITLFSVLRYDTGWDYMSYYDTVLEWGGNSFSMERYSIIWQWMFETAQRLNMPHLAIALPGFLTITCVYFAVSKILGSKQAVCDSLTIYALWPFFYLGTFSTIRQSLAISIALVILYCAMNRKWIWFVILILVNTLIHTSAIVCVFYGVFFLKDFRLRIGQMVLILIIAIAAMVSIDYVISNITILQVYAGYTESTDSFGEKLSLLLGILLIPTLMVREKKGINRGMADLCIIALVLTITIVFLLSKSVILRVADYYVILLIFIAPYYGSIFKDKATGKALVYMAFVGIFFVYLMITAGAYQQGLATSPFVPYKFIFLQ